MFVSLKGFRLGAGIFDARIITVDSLSRFIKFLDKWLDRRVLQVLTHLNKIIITGTGKGELFFLL